jgi:Fic family protein
MRDFPNAGVANFMAAYASPPFSISSSIEALVRDIVVAMMPGLMQQNQSWQQQREHQHRLCKVQASLAMEHLTLDVEEVADILSGRRISAWPREVRAVKNAYATHELLPFLQANSMEDLLNAHHSLMLGLIADAGRLRLAGSGLALGGRMLYVAPPAQEIPELVGDLLGWLSASRVHPLIAGCVFHCELEFLHPFSDGNGRMGRLWQSLIHRQWSSLFTTLPWEIHLLREQDAFYQILVDCERAGHSTTGVEFLLEMTLRALRESTVDVSRRDFPKTHHYRAW